MHLFDQHLRLFFVRLKLHSRPIVQYIVVIFIQNISDLVRKFLVLINDLIIDIILQKYTCGIRTAALRRYHDILSYGTEFPRVCVAQRHPHSRVKRNKLKFESERKLNQTRFCNHIFLSKISFVCENMGSDQACAHISFSRKPPGKMVNIDEIG